jgi:hypothetical protein
MADVSVEFGAKDVGLEKTLKTIQDQMVSLQGEVDSGTLSFQEISQKMREIKTAEGIFAKLGGEVSEAAKSFKELEDQTRRAEAVTKSNRTATEIYNQEIESLQKHLNAGRISMDTFERAVAKADAQLAAANPQVKDIGNQIETAGDKTKSLGGIFDAEFQKIAGAFTVGNLAAQGFQKIVELAFGAARQVVQGFSDALDLGGRLNELSSRTGETAGKLLVLETAFKNSGLEAAQVGTAINKLQNFMQDAANGGDKQRAAMQSLGISMSDLAGKTPTEEMQIFADRIAAIEDPTQRAALASEVFGDKLGGKLLPLFSDFSGNLDDAREKVGSLEQVMDENAATFDAAAETIEAVKGKMAAFAAGVLSETIPALEDLGKSMEQVDAAGLGQDVGEFLSPRLEKLSFVTIGASEALKELIDLLTTAPSNTSTFGKAVNAVAESLDGFNYYMQKAINFISPMDDLWTMLEQKGRDAADAQDTAAASIASTGTAAQTAATGLQNVGTASDTAAGKVDALGTSAQSTGQNIASAFSVTSDFAPKLDEISGSWGGVNDQILGGKNLLSDSYTMADSMTGKIDEQVTGFGGVNEQLTISKDLSSIIDTTYGKHAEKLAEIQDKQDALAAKETERKDKLSEALNFELAMNEAKAAGDIELVKTLENQKLFNAELKKAIDAGMGEKEAAAFARQMVNAKDAAASVQVNTSTVSAAKNEAAAAATAAQSFATWLDYIKGVDPSAPVKSLKEQTADARKEINAFGEYIGTDLKNKSFPDVARELGITDLATTGTEQMNQILAHIASKRGELIGIQPIDEKGGNTALDGIQSKLKDLTTKTTKVPLDGDTNPLKETLSAFSAGAIKLTLDAADSIAAIRTALAEPIKMDLDGSGGGGNAQGGLTGLVESIKSLLEKIEPKLPVAALV